ncbi:hypothetical protein ABTK03_21010, partial [Acinetobacter baumannii]
THYTKGITGSAPFRARLTQIASAADVAVILAELAEKVGGTEARLAFLEETETFVPHVQPTLLLAGARA